MIPFLFLATCQKNGANSHFSTEDDEGVLLSNFIPLIDNLSENDIDSVCYQIEKHNHEGHYSFCDYIQNYRNKDQKDIHRIYDYLKKCKIIERKGFPGGSSDEKMTYTINFKDHTKLECVVYGNLIKYFYSSSEVFHLKQMPENVRSYILLASDLPLFYNLEGYTYTKDYFSLASIQDKENSGQYVNAPGIESLAKMVFINDEALEVPNELNNYNRYFISNDSAGYIVFESSKKFRIESGAKSGDYGRYRIINDISFEDLKIEA